MRIGIFGGCFNPPHKMHENIANYLVKENFIHKIIFVPTGRKYKKNNLESNINRYNMLKIMCLKSPYMKVSKYEFKNELVYTYQTLDYFKKKYPNDEIYFICGTDNLKILDTWKNYEYIIDNYKFLVIGRNNDVFNDLIEKYKKYKDHIVFANVPASNISSSFIREEIKKNQFDQVDKYIDKDILDYIKKLNLYL